MVAQESPEKPTKNLLKILCMTGMSKGLAECKYQGAKKLLTNDSKIWTLFNAEYSVLCTYLKSFSSKSVYLLEVHGMACSHTLYIIISTSQQDTQGMCH